MPTAVDSAEGGVILRIGFQAPPEVQAFVEDESFVKGYFGPFGCAKTSAGVITSWRYGQARPGARGAVIRSTWPALRDTTQKTYFEWLPPGVAGHYEHTKKTLWLQTSAEPIEVLFRAMDDPADIQNVLSLDLAFAHLDEPQGGVGLRRDGTAINEPGLNHDLFLAILARLGRQQGYPGQAWLTGNPPSPSHWIPKFFYYDPGVSHHDPPGNPDPERTLYLGTRETNRANLPKGYYERLERLYGVGTPMAKRFLDGEWIEFATEQPFHTGWVRYVGTPEDPVPNGSDMVVEAGIDPAISKRDTASTTAIVVAGQQRVGINRGRICILHAEEGHWSVYEQCDRLLKLVVAKKIRMVRIEDVAYQRALGEVLERESRQRGITVHVDLVRPDADKLRRANAWSALVEDGTVVFAPGLKNLVDAMLAVPGDQTRWNLVDAAGICVRGFPLMQGESERIPGLETSKPTLATGYATRPKSAEHNKPRPAPAGFTKITKVPALKRAMGYAVRPAPKVPAGAGKYS